jgi:hypothetical protein
MPVGNLLKSMRGVEDPGFSKVIALDLQPDRQTALVETAGNRHRRRPGQVAGDGENIVQVHLDRIVAFFSETERSRRRCRPDDQVATVVGATKIIRDQPTDLLRLQVVRVVVAVREHVGADQDAALDLGAEAFGAGLAVHVVEVAVARRAVPVAHAVEARQVGRGFGGCDHIVDGDRQVDVGETDVDGDRAEAAEFCERGLDRPRHGGVRSFSCVLARQADA